jgi:WD40 repeat protein
MLEKIAQSAILSLAVAKVDDHNVIISGGEDGKVRLWDLASARPVGVPLWNHEGCVTSVATGKLEGRPMIVSGGLDGKVRLGDPTEGGPLSESIRAHDGFVRSLATGELEGRPVILSGGEDGTVRIWDAASGQPVGEPLKGHNGIVFSLAVAKVDGRTVIVSGGEDGTVRLWDAGSGQPVGEPLVPPTYDAPGLAVAVGELEGLQVIVSAVGREGTVRVCGVNGRLEMELKVNSAIYAIALTSDSKIVVGAGAGVMVLKLNAMLSSSRPTIPTNHSPDSKRST